MTSQRTHLSSETLAAIGPRLEAERRALRAAMAEAAPHPTTAAAERFKDCQQRLNQVNAALTRLKRGTFGFCDRCDQRVAAVRLAAVPTTTLCRSCAARRSAVE